MNNKYNLTNLLLLQKQSNSNHQQKKNYSIHMDIIKSNGLEVI